MKCELKMFVRRVSIADSISNSAGPQAVTARSGYVRQKASKLTNDYLGTYALRPVTGRAPPAIQILSATSAMSSRGR